MEYFKIKDINQRDIFINLENVLWIEFLEEELVITFHRGENDSVNIFIAEGEYGLTKENLIKVLSSSMRVVFD